MRMLVAIIIALLSIAYCNAQEDKATDHLIRGIALQHTGEEKAALLQYDSAIALGLHQYVAYHNRAGLLLVMTRYEESLRDIDSALRFQPGDIATIGLRARCYLHLRELPKALKDANVYLAQYPTDGELLAVRGRIHLELHDYQNACLDFKNAKELGEPNIDRFVITSCRD